MIGGIQTLVEDIERLEDQVERLRDEICTFKTLYGRAFMTARELMDSSAYQLFVEMMDIHRHSLEHKSPGSKD